MNTKSRLLKNIERVMVKEGLTPELEDKICNLYIFDKLTDDEFTSIISEDVEDEEINEEVEGE